MELSKGSLELLRDEAYVILCRQTVQQSLESLDEKKAGLVSSRPPFGVLAARKAREAFESSLHAAEEDEAALRHRLTRVARYETWLQRCIRRDLAEYLETVSAEYQRVGQIKRLLDDWEKVVTHALADTLVAFAREMRGLRQVAAAAGRGEQPFGHELAVFREIAARLETQHDQLAHFAANVNTFALELGLLEVRVPPLPQFRRSIWVDSLRVLPLSQAVAEITRAEGEVRAFLNGLPSIAGRLQASRVACAQRQEQYLQQYWEQLRDHAQAHWVEERDVDEVLDTLAKRYDPEIARLQREVTHNPFSTGR